MERTISAMIGKGSVNHNTRAFTAKNVDKNRSADNVEFCQEDIKQVYHKLFDEALERYNAKQKRKDRMIDNYYEKIRRSKQEKLFHEVIFQIGNKDDMNAKNEDGLLAKRILTEFMDEFQARNPNLYVFSAHLHMDEETPHLHIDFVPYITGSKRGLDTRVSLKSALAAEGFTGGTRGATELNQWIESEKQEGAASAGKVLLATVKGDVHDIGKNIVSVVMACNGYEIIDLGVMVPAETIVQRAIEEKVNMIGLSGLITPSLDEMVHVAIELEKAGLDVPLLIGGATTSPLHTALKIAPVYHAPVIHLKDASQNATVAARLMNPNQKEEFVKKLSNKYQQLREKNQEKQVETVSLEEAKANRLNLF